MRRGMGMCALLQAMGFWQSCFFSTKRDRGSNRIMKMMGEEEKGRYANLK